MSNATAITEIRKRCEAADIPLTEDKVLGEDWLKVSLPDGRGTRSMTLSRSRIQSFVNIDFENFRFIEGYRAVLCRKRGIAEGYIERAAGRGNLQNGLLRALGHRMVLPGSDVEVPDPLIEVEDEHGLTATIGFPSKELATLLLHNQGQVAFRLEGEQLSTGDARSIFEKVAEGLFFQLDSRVNLPIVLSRQRAFRGEGITSIEASSLSFPDSEFDPEPMSLYWYGRGARTMPLLQFLAFYQVMEFYFPMYAAAEARRRIKLIVGNPAFNPHDGRDIQRVLLASAVGAGSREREQDQLRSTVRHCADPDWLRSYVLEHDEFFGKRTKGLTDQVLRPAMGDEEMLDAVARRTYEIRCKIVHTKDSEPSKDQGLLLPFSKEAELLKLDIRLLQGLARQALVSASRPRGF
jgi:hypothetical protein